MSLNTVKWSLRQIILMIFVSNEQYLNNMDISPDLINLKFRSSKTSVFCTPSIVYLAEIIPLCSRCVTFQEIWEFLIVN